MRRRARFSAERVANAQVRQLEDEARVRDGRDVLVNAADWDLWDVDERRVVTAAERIRLLYGLRV